MTRSDTPVVADADADGPGQSPRLYVVDDEALTVPRRGAIDLTGDLGRNREVLLADGEAVATWAAEHPNEDLPTDVEEYVLDNHRMSIGDRGRDAGTATVDRLRGLGDAYRALWRNFPRGAGRLLVRLARWEADTGYNADREAMRREAPDKLLDAKADHRRVIRNHFIESALAIAVVIGLMLFADQRYGGWQVLAAVGAAALVAVPAIGWVGTDDPRAMLTRVFRSAAAVPKMDHSLIIHALQNVPGALGSHMRKDPRALDRLWHVDPMRTASGWEAVFDLPVGSVETCLLKDEQIEGLAAGLRRDTSLVWPSVVDVSEGGHAGRCRLTVLRQPLRDGKMPPWPLLNLDGPRSVFDPVPIGVDHLGQIVRFPGINMPCVLVGAIPKHGKTCLLVQYALGISMDPRTELWIFDGKADVDWDDVGELVAHRYVKTIPGDPDDAFQALSVLRELDGELKRRRKAKELYRAQTGISSSTITEGMVAAGIGLHPVLVIIDETQTYFLDAPADVRAEIKTLITRVAKQGRSFGVTMVLATQTIKDQTIPVDISGTAGGQIALKTGGYRESQQILGASCTANGFRPEDLRNLADAGIGYVQGDGMGTKLTRFYYLNDQEGEVRQAAERSHQFRLAAGLLTGHAAGHVAEDTGPLLGLLDMTMAAFNSSGVDRLLWPELLDICQRTFPAIFADMSADSLSADVRSAGGQKVDTQTGQPVDIIRSTAVRSKLTPGSDPAKGIKLSELQSAIAFRAEINPGDEAENV